MNSRKLSTLALYLLQAILWLGALTMGAAILGGMFFLTDASRKSYGEMRSETLHILKNEFILIALATLFLFGIGSVRTYLKNMRETGQRKQSMSTHSQSSQQI